MSETVKVREATDGKRWIVTYRGNDFSANKLNEERTHTQQGLHDSLCRRVLELEAERPIDPEIFEHVCQALRKAEDELAALKGQLQYANGKLSEATRPADAAVEQRTPREKAQHLMQTIDKAQEHALDSKELYASPAVERVVEAARIAVDCMGGGYAKDQLQQALAALDATREEGPWQDSEPEPSTISVPEAAMREASRQVYNNRKDV